MFLIKRFRCSKNFQLIKRHWLKGCIFLFILVIIILLILKWKYDLELIRLNDIRRAQMNNIKKMISLSNTKSKMKDIWRTPDFTSAAIFAAYLDSRPEVVLEEVSNSSYENLWALIRIIAIIPVNAESSAMTCYYQFPADLPHSNSNQSLILESPVVAVRIIARTENFGMHYSAAFVLCKLITTEDGRLPLMVTFSSNTGKTFQDLDKVDFVDVHYTTRTNDLDQDKFMAVCVPGLHHNYSQYANLIEFVEFYRMMGVDHFTFYNTSVSTEVNRVLSYYQDKGVATVIQWKLPSQYIYERTLRYNGIFAAMNECLYRSTMIGGFKYVVNVDLDEFIVPRKHENFRQMMNHLDPKSEENKYAVFLLRNIFFYLMHEDSPILQNPSDIPKLLLHTKTVRWDQINPAYDRSKYIVRGQEVIEMGNHRVWQTRKISLVFRTNYRETIVDPVIAGSHHYRYCEVNELVCWLRGTVIDEVAHKFTYKLGSRMKAVLGEIFRK